MQKYTSILLNSDLHFGMHAAVDGGNTPGWTSSDQAISCRWKDSFLILIEGLQWRILAWTLQLVSIRQEDEEEEEREEGKE